MTYRMELSKKLREAREKLGLEPKELAERIGVRTRDIRDAERLHRNSMDLDLPLLAKIRTFLGVTM